MAEVLIVVAIIAVLLGVGAVALFSHMRSLHQLEMDGQAKEIFVAAQNHLSMAESQGYLNRSGFGTQETTDGDVYYYIVGTGNGSTSLTADNQVLSLMLPFGAVDESARTGGSYIIRYQKSTGTILDVFYASSDSRFGYAFSTGTYATVMATRDDRSARRSFSGGKVLGYYGGVEARDLPKGEPLLPPEIEIVNAEKLYVLVTDPNGSDSTASSSNILQLIITGESSGAQRLFTLYGGTGDSRMNHTIGTDSYIVILDSVTDANHFYNLSATTDAVKFQPGENVLVKGVAMNNSVLTNVAESGTCIDNSLFASLSSTTAEIANIRHLENLDANVSKLSAPFTVTKASQIDNLSWPDFQTKAKANSINYFTSNTTTATTADGNFYPVAATVTEYDGKGHNITGVKYIDSTSTAAAGLFRSFSGNTIKDLELLDFIVDTKGDAGALAGELSGVNLSGILVRNTDFGDADNSDKDKYIASASGNAGGLVGKLTGGSVDGCAAAVYVSGGVNAGGLIGIVSAESAGTVSISNSYSGGHTKNKEYQNDFSALAEGRYNVISSGVAGGLIGDASGSYLNIQYCYSTASAHGETAGGLLGKANTGKAAKCYTVGLVEGTTKGAFAGSLGNTFDLSDKISVTKPGSTDTENVYTNFYLDNISQKADQKELNLLHAAFSDSNYKTDKFLVPESQRVAAIPYDTALTSRYDFPTIQLLHNVFGSSYTPSGLAASLTAVHYGDWQTPTMEFLHYTLINSDKLYSEITLGSSLDLTIAVYGEHSGHARAYYLTVNDARTSVTSQAAYPLKNGEIDYEDTSLASLALPLNDTNIAYDRENDVYTLTVYLDDITKENGHFAQLFAQSATLDYNLTPGENITLLVAGGKCSWSELQSLLTKTYPDDMADSGKIIALSDNSLFAKNTAIAEKENETNGKSYADSSEYKSLLAKMANGKDPEDTDYMSAEIKLFRHLQNLDNSTSDVSGVTGATLLFERKITVDGVQKTEKCLNWSDVSSKYPQVYNVGGTKPVSGGFVGIYNEQLQKLEGNNRTIEGLPVKAAPDGYGDSDTGIGNVGFFRYLDSGKSLTVKELHLKDLNFEKAKTGYAGAFVAQSLGTLSLEHSLAEAKADYEVNGKSAAGGLVGLSSGNLTIQNSAASMLITSAGPAGGLVGKQTGNTTLIITDSYVGGHTYNGMYYPTVDDNIESDDNGVNTNGKRWNIISSGGEAGGLVGCLDTNTTAKIARSFNTATVFGSTAGGIIGQASGSFAAVSGSQILDLVYTIAPVYNVTQLAYDETDGFTATVGNSGSVFGQISGLDAFDNSKLFFLPDTFSKPIALEISNGATDEDEIVSYTSITPIGNFSGEDELLNDDENLKTIFENIHLASYYRRTTGNDIIGTKSTTQLEQETTVFDNSLMGEYYPFAIWTTFNFDGSEARHFYGDWQPVESRNTIQLHVHLVYVKPASADGSSARVVSVEEQKQSIQIPYDAENAPAAILLPYLPEYFGFDYGNWQKYYGDHSAGYKTCVTDTTASLPDTSSYVAGDTFTVNTGSVNLSATDFNTLYSNRYTGIDGKEHVHLTLVSNYKEKDYKVYKLQLFDHDPPSGDYSEYGGYKVLELTDDKKADDGKWYFNSLVDVKDFDLINKKIDGKYYRVSGWYLRSGEDEKRVVKFVYQDTDTTDGKNYEYVPQWDIANFEVTGNIDLYAKYEEVVTCSLTIRFVDGNKNEISGLKSYSIPFEAEQGFHQTLTLPGDPADTREDKLWPDLSKDWSVTPNTYAGETTSGFFERNTYDATNLFQTNDLQLQVNIPPVSREKSLTDAEKKIVYTVVYRGAEEAVKKGFAVVYELMHTKYENDTLKYSDSDSDSYVYDFHLGKNGSTNLPDYLFGLTNEGEYPNTELMDENGKTLEAKLGEYLTDTLQSEGFEPVITFVPIDLENASSVPEKYRGKYAATVTKDGKFVTTTSTDDLDVTYLVVVQGYRKKFPIVYDTRGGNIIKAATEAEKQYFNVEYGASIGFMVNKAAEGAASTIPSLLIPVYPKIMPEVLDNNGQPKRVYTFDYWYQTVKENDKDVDKAILATDTMPAHNLTVHAHRTGNEVPYTVAFWHENADDEGSSYVTYIKIDPSQSPYNTSNNPYVRNAGSSISAAEFMALYGNTHYSGWSNDFEYNPAVSERLSNLKNTGDAAKEEVEVRADGNTVLNIVMARKERHIAFYLRGNWTPETGTINSNTDYYAPYGKDFVKLEERETLVPSIWYPEYEYTKKTSVQDGVQYFGMIGSGEYVPIVKVESYTYASYQYNANDYDPGAYYCTRNDEYGYRIRYDKNKWVYYNSGSNYANGNARVYKRTTNVSWEYLTQTTSSSNNYYYIENASGGYEITYLYRSGGKWYDYYTDREYVGIVYNSTTTNYDVSNGFFTREVGSKEWKDGRLKRSGSFPNYNYSPTGTGDDYDYGKDNYGGHVKLNKVSYRWKYTVTKNGQSETKYYTGTPYKWVGNNNAAWTVFHYWTGKINSTFDSNGYSWSSIQRINGTDYAWNESEYLNGQGQTYLEAFTIDENEYKLYGVTTSYNRYIYHYRQGLNNSYPNDPVVVGAYRDNGYYGIGASNIKFGFSDKFDQFQVDSYYRSTSTTTGYNSNGSTHINRTEHSDGTVTFNPDSAILDGTYYSLHIYHKRNSYKLVFMNGADDAHPVEKTLKYDAPFSSFTDLPNNPTTCPVAGDGYKFRGWSLDPTMQDGSAVIWDNQKVFNAAGAPVTTMPAGAKAGSTALVLYAKWTRDAHDVTFDATTVESWAAGKAPELEFTAEKGKAIAYGATLPITDVSAYVPERKGYTFEGWVYTDTNGQEVDFMLLTPITENLALRPKWTAKQSVTVWVKHVTEATEDEAETLLGWEPVDVYVGDFHKFNGSNSFSGWIANPRSVKVLIDSAWLNSSTNIYSDADDTEHNGKPFVKMTYMKEKSQMEYKVKYYLSLKTMAGEETFIEIPSLEREEKPATKFAVEQFYELPEGLKGYTVTEIGVYEGNTLKTSTNDPVVFIQKSAADNIEIRVKVAVAGNFLSAQSKHISYNRNTRNITDEDVLPGLPELLPKPPVISGVTTRTEYTYNDSTTAPSKAGVYDVRIRQIINIGGTDYVFWDSRDQNPGLVALYIDRREIILKSQTVDNAFRDTQTNREYVATWNETHEELKLIIDEDGVVETSTIDTSETTEWATLKDWVEVFFTVEAFRSNYSSGVNDYSPNTFEYFLKDGVDEDSVNVYKVTGKLYLWKDQASYEKYNPPAG